MVVAFLANDNGITVSRPQHLFAVDHVAQQLAPITAIALELVPALGAFERQEFLHAVHGFFGVFALHVIFLS